MERLMTARRLYFSVFLKAVCCACSVLYAIGNTNPYASGDDMPGSPRIDELFAHTRPVCIGRFLIDLPIEAEIVFGPAHAPYPVTVYADEAAGIDSFVARRLAQIRAEKPPAYGALAAKDSMVGTVIDGVVPSQKSFLVLAAPVQPFIWLSLT